MLQLGMNKKRVPEPQEFFCSSTVLLSTYSVLLRSTTYGTVVAADKHTVGTVVVQYSGIAAQNFPIK